MISWFRATRDLLKSFGWGIRGTPSVICSSDGAIFSPPAPSHLAGGGRRIRTVGPPCERVGLSGRTRMRTRRQGSKARIRRSSARCHRDQARSRSRYAADHRLQGDHAGSCRYAQICGRAFGPRGGRMAVSRLGFPRAAAVAEQLRTRRVDHAARQSEFSWVRRFPAHGVGPCRPGARRSVPRLIFRAAALGLSFFEADYTT